MEYLVTYDKTGFIISKEQGSVLREPVGIPFIRVTIPTGKDLIRIDVSVTPNVPVYEDIAPPYDPIAWKELTDKVKELDNKIGEINELTLARIVTMMKGLTEVYGTLLDMQLKLK